VRRTNTSMMNYPVCHDQLDSVVQNALLASNGSCARSMGAIQSVVGRIVRDALQNEGLLGSLAQQSSLHINGFYKVPLVSAPDDRFSIRLHVWKHLLPRTDAEDADVHNHRWNFATKVLQGAYVSRTFRDSPVGKRVSKQRCWSSEGCADYRVENEGVGCIELLEETAHGAGTSYVLHSHVLHQVVPIAAPTVTIMVRGVSLHAWSSVRSLRSSAAGGLRSIRRPKAAELAALLGGVLNDVECKE
jgi:hypothetical protein